jgi:predicted  nucleic acid-binding Zn-ribbon protein
MSDKKNIGNEDKTAALKHKPSGNDISARILSGLEDVKKDVSKLRDELSELRLEVSRRGDEFNEFRDRVDSKLLKNTQPLGETLDAVRTDVRDIKSTVGKIDRTISVLSRDMIDVRADVAGLDRRITNVES